MKSTLVILSLSILTTLSAYGTEIPVCQEMSLAAQALGKINGGTFTSASYRIPPTPSITEVGFEFGYQFDVLYSPGDELPNKKIGIIKVKALIKNGSSKCKVLSLHYSDI